MQAPLLRRRLQVTTADFGRWVREVLWWRFFASMFWCLAGTSILLITMLLFTGVSTFDVLCSTLFLLLSVAQHGSLRVIVTGKFGCIKLPHRLSSSGTPIKVLVNCAIDVETTACALVAYDVPVWRVVFNLLARIISHFLSLFFVCTWGPAVRTLVNLY